MPFITAAIQGQIQEMRAQNLATLMQVVDPVQSVARTGSATSESKQPLLTNSTLSELGAVVLAPPRAGKIMLAVQGEHGSQVIEAELPPELLRMAARNPALFREGVPVLLKLDPETHSFKLVLPQAEGTTGTQHNAAPPATIRSLSANTPAGGAPALQAAPPLAAAFPAGSIGGAIAKLAGLAFPLSEMEADGQSAPLSTMPRADQPFAQRPAAAALSQLPQELGEAALRASVRQLPLAHAMSALLALAGKPDASPELAALTKLISAMRLDASGKPDSESLRQAVRQSGVFLEAGLAKADAAPMRDLKSALLGLRALAPGEASAPSTDVARLAEGAVERIKLTQIASLPNHPDMMVNDDRGQGMRLAMTIPLATRGPDQPHTAAMGLMVEHRPLPEDVRSFEVDPETGEKQEAFPWKVRIALDLEETGPVQAEIGLRGQNVTVTLWAERKTLAAEARAQIGALHAALRQAAFEVGKLEVKDGHPTGKAMRFAPMLDRRT